MLPNFLHSTRLSSRSVFARPWSPWRVATIPRASKDSAVADGYFNSLDIARASSKMGSTRSKSPRTVAAHPNCARELETPCSSPSPR
jgi:hypothetical protein